MIIPTATNKNYIPSNVLITKDETIFVGWSALNHPEKYNSKNITIGSVKRLMGRQGETGWGWWRTYPQEISALILAKLRMHAEKYLGVKVSEAVIAIPSHFDEAQRRATLEAAEIAGFTVLRLLNEATAAALTYGLLYKNSTANERIMVFDLGGGTLDVSVVEINENVFEVLCIEGDTNLGGDDFDKVLVDYIVREAKSRYNIDLLSDSRQNPKLYDYAEQMKINLSTKIQTSIKITPPLKSEIKEKFYTIKITRNEFEELSKELVLKAKLIIKKVMAQIKTKNVEIDKVILLGGGSQMPIIKTELEKLLSMKVLVLEDAMTWIAKGAVLQGAIMKRLIKEAILIDVLPSTYGVGLEKDVFKSLIMKNTIVPVEKTHLFTTSRNNQTSIEIPIYQGDKPKTYENRYLGRLTLYGIPPLPKGRPKIEVKFEANADMIMSVTATDTRSNSNQSFSIESPYRLNPTQIKLMMKKIQDWQKMNVKTELLSLLKYYENNFRNILTKNSVKIDEDIYHQIKRICEHIEEKDLKSEISMELLDDCSELYLQATNQIEQYDMREVEINNLIKQLSLIEEQLNKLENSNIQILFQGRELLTTKINQVSNISEIYDIFSAIQADYRRLSPEIVLEFLKFLIPYHQILTLQKEIELYFPFNIVNYLESFKETQNVKNLMEFINQEDFEKESIFIRLLINDKVNKKKKDLLEFLITAFIMNFTREKENELKKLIFANLNEGIQLALFYHVLKTETEQILIQLMNLIPLGKVNTKFFPIIMHLLENKSNDKLDMNLILYLQKFPFEELLEFFSNAKQSVRTKIVSYPGVFYLFLNDSTPDQLKMILKAIESLELPVNLVSTTWMFLKQLKNGESKEKKEIIFIFLKKKMQETNPKLHRFIEIIEKKEIYGLQYNWKEKFFLWRYGKDFWHYFNDESALQQNRYNGQDNDRKMDR